MARLVPVQEPESPLERLFAAGLLGPAEDPGDLLDVEPGPPVPPGRPTASEILWTRFTWASALSVRADLTALVSYDKRMLAAAQEAGLPTACPA